MKVLHVVGARPNFVKIAPLMRALSGRGTVAQQLVHTGQHYDDRMSAAFFRDLAISEPDVNLNIGSGSHAFQTAEIMKAFEPVLGDAAPDLVVVVGDVNSTVAASLVAAKCLVPVAHVEAGLRSRDRTMPEEINRVVTDQLATLLLTPSRDADRNLLAEGIAAERIHFVGNIMIDTLRRLLPKAAELDMPARLEVADKPYAVVTLHRPSNVDDPVQLEQIVGALATLAADRPVLFPMHPRTRRNAERFRLLGAMGKVQVTEPLPYLEMLGLLQKAALVLTDSGGIQEETTALGVPCLTLRDSTERPVTIEQGTNTLVPVRTGEQILAAVSPALGKQGRLPEGWDGRTADRIADVFHVWHEARRLPVLARAKV